MEAFCGARETNLSTAFPGPVRAGRAPIPCGVRPNCHTFRLRSGGNQDIAQAAKELVEQRDRWLNAEGLSEAEKKKRTLTNLYNARPTWLDLAHKRLDEAVFAAYGWQPSLNDEEILEKLLALNLKRAKR